ncbi:MAG: hypothetical protein IAI50_20080 [Candidatus Eremiobacteraeota bacterium]|nr:hypothetical protein [Candidatus Eremiobacteraeota bacterium]
MRGMLGRRIVRAQIASVAVSGSFVAMLFAFATTAVASANEAGHWAPSDVVAGAVSTDFVVARISTAPADAPTRRSTKSRRRLRMQRELRSRFRTAAALYGRAFRSAVSG